MNSPERFEGPGGGAGFIDLRARRGKVELTWGSAGCRGCALGGPQTIWGRGAGPLDARVALVGLNPSVIASPGVVGCFLSPFLAYSQGRGDPPKAWLRGSTGAFWRLAQAARLDLGACYSTNAVKCATPANRRPGGDEISSCAQIHLTPELKRLTELKLVLCFGLDAAVALGVTPSFAAHQPANQTWRALVLHHPSYLLRHEAATTAAAGRRIREFLGSEAEFLPTKTPELESHV